LELELADLTEQNELLKRQVAKFEEREAAIAHSTDKPEDSPVGDEAVEVVNLLEQDVVEVEEVLTNIPGLAANEVEAVNVEVEEPDTSPEQASNDNLIAAKDVCVLLGVENYQLSKMSNDKIKAKGFERVKVGKKSKYKKLSLQG
jgi:hypothetical protein